MAMVDCGCGLAAIIGEAESVLAGLKGVIFA
jgi:hypothetical protein